MKYSKWLGLLAAVIIIVCCYLPWISVPAAHLEIAGMWASAPHNFGKPGLVNLVCSVVAALFFLVPLVWAKRTNIFIVGLNLAWALRNFILLGKCYNGDCPEKKIALYILVGASVLMLLMSLFPDVEVSEKETTKSAD